MGKRSNKDNNIEKLEKEVLYLYKCYQKEIDIEVRYELQKEILRLSFWYGVDLEKLNIIF